MCLERMVSLAWSFRYCSKAMGTAANLSSLSAVLRARKLTWYTSAWQCHWWQTKYITVTKFQMHHAAMMGHPCKIRHMISTLYAGVIKVPPFVCRGWLLRSFDQVTMVPTVLFNLPRDVFVLHLADSFMLVGPNCRKQVYGNHLDGRSDKIKTAFLDRWMDGWMDGFEQDKTKTKFAAIPLSYQISSTH